MPVYVDWSNSERTVLRFDFVHPWTLEEYKAANSTALELAAQVDHPFDYLTVLSSPGAFVVNPYDLIHFMHTHHKWPVNACDVVLVSTHRMIPLLVNLVQRWYPRFTHRYFIVATVEQANALLSEIQQMRQVQA